MTPSPQVCIVCVKIILFLFNRFLLIRNSDSYVTPVKPVEQDVYEEVQTPDVISPVTVATNPVYGLVDHQ